MTTYDAPNDDKGLAPNNSSLQDSSTNTTNCTYKNNNLITLELTEVAKERQIIASFVFDKRIDSLRLTLNHKSRQKIIISPVEDNWPKTIETFTNQLKLKHVKKQDINQLCDVVDNNADMILDLEHHHDDVDDNHQNSKGDEMPTEQEVELLRSKIPNNDFLEYAFDTVRKTIKQENALVRQIGYTGLSAYTNDPLNLGIMAPTSEGKTYPVTEMMQFFPKADVWNIGNMTPKVLINCNW
jgi:hypothetical protein